VNVALRPEHLNIISICTGGGGLDLGVELAIQGARSVCMVEREAFAVSSLVSAMEQGLLHPAPVWSDARSFDGRAWRGAVDGVIGGIPCQPHSLAGRKRGSLDARDLWSDARRIIVQSGAWFAVIENVGGMLSAGADEVAGAERVWRDLRKLGFQVEIGLFTAAEVGASHERERVFILAIQDLGDAAGQRSHATPFTGADSRNEGGRARHAQSQRRGGYVVTSEVADAGGYGQLRSTKPHIGSIGPKQQAPRRSDAERCDCSLVDADAGASEVREGHAAFRGRWAEQPASDRAASRSVGLFPPGPNDVPSWRDTLSRSPELEPAFRRVADGLASRLDIARVDRLRMLGNGVVPLQAAYAIRTLVTRLAARGSAGAARLVRMMEMAAP
jgi:DNA (cytosine-5)-methyltransferase 1